MLVLARRASMVSLQQCDNPGMDAVYGVLTSCTHTKPLVFLYNCRASMVSLQQLPSGVMELMKEVSDPVGVVWK